ncbi:MAG: hypothetical protein ACTSQB_04985, partial [Candidatus Heimdallarchaeota archaeon]
IDVTTPSAPTEVATYSTPSTIYAITVSGNYAYLARGGGVCDIVDISTISSPSYVGYGILGMTIEDLQSDANTLYVSGWYGFQIYDLSDPTSPSLLAYYTMDEEIPIKHLYLNGTTLITSLQSRGIEIFNITTKSSPTLLGAFFNYGLVCDLDIDEDLAYMVTTYGLVILDISDSENPQLVNHTHMYDENHLGLRILVHEEIAYVVLKGYLRIFDVSNPYNPILLNETLNIWQTWDMKIRGNYLYTAHLSYIRIIDISDPSTPVIVTSYHNVLDAKGLSLKDNYLFLACENSGIRVLDITTLASPSIFTSFNFGGNVKTCVVDGDYLYTYAFTNGLYAINISDMNSIDLVDSETLITSAYNNNMVVEGQYIYFTSDTSGVYIYDKTDPSNLLYSGRFYDDTGEAFGLKVHEGTIYCADFADGLEIIKHDSDGDGLTNYEEIEIYHSNPDVVDSDGDGLDDYVEVYDIGTDPTNNDTDSDMIDDFEETVVGSDGFITDPLDADTDGDGFDDGAEVLAGTDPTDPDDHPTGAGGFNILLSISLVVLSLLSTVLIRRKKSNS